VIDDYRGELASCVPLFARALPGSAGEAFLVADLDAVDPVELRRRLAGVVCALVAFYCLESVGRLLAAANVPVGGRRRSGPR